MPEPARRSPPSPAGPRRVGDALRAGPALLALAALGAACFGGVLWRGGQFGFRDAGHYFYPLHLSIQREWQAGRWPLWDPGSNAGMPLLGNPAAAVLYPGKVVFFLLPYAWAARFYVVLHVVLAFASMRTMLRSWHVSATGAGLGALAYAFGAPVLSQACNVIYLVGAAWAPLGFLAADRWLRLGRPGARAGLALVLAMQVLGGDPQASYVTVVCASGYAAGLAASRGPVRARRVVGGVALGLLPAYLALLALASWSARASHASSVAAGGATPPSAPPAGVIVCGAWGVGAAVLLRRIAGGRDRGRFGRMMAGLAGASALAVAVAGAQVVPAVEFLRRSARASETQGAYDVYRFGVHPLQVVEAIWPNVFGTDDRGHRSWAAALPGARDPQLWVPSLYLGALTLALASAGAGFRGGPPWRGWLTAVALASFLLSLGAYTSPLLWARGVPGWQAALGPPEVPVVPRVRADGFLRDGDGGLYWFLASALPAFRSFRYPAKFLVFTALAISGLAGAGFDRLVEGRPRRARVVAGCLLGASVMVLAAAWLGGGPLRAWLGARAGPIPSVYGPFDAPGAIADLRGALVQGGLSLAAALFLTVAAARRPRVAGAVALAALAVDLGLANARHAGIVPQSAFEGAPRVWDAIRAAERADPSPGPFRVQRVGSWTPRGWLTRGSPRRAEEIVRWERDTLRPDYGLPFGADSTFSLGTAELFDYGFFFFPWAVQPDRATALALGLRPGQHVLYHPRRGFDLWNTRYFIVPLAPAWDNPERAYAALLPRTTPIWPAPGTFEGPGGPARREQWAHTEDVRVLRNEAALPRAWVVHQVRAAPTVVGMRASDRRELMREMLYQADALWNEPKLEARDPRRVAWIEAEHPEEVARSVSGAAPDPTETVTVIREDPQFVELLAVLHSPGLVVLADADYPGWTLRVDGRSAAILRTNRVMRGAVLPSGRHRLVFRYEPTSFRLGLGLSAAGCAFLAALGLRWARGSRPFGPGVGL